MGVEAPLILVDANLLIYAFDKGAFEHERARSWLEGALSGSSRVGLPWESLLAFLRITTNPRLFPSPAQPKAAWHQVRRWLDSPVAWVPLPTDRHSETLETLLQRAGAAGNDVHDAHLAAIALQHGLVLCSADRDFARFPGLRFENPLAAQGA